MRRFALHLLLCVLSVSAPARAETAEDTHGQFKKGLAAMQAENWGEAFETFDSLWQNKRTYDVALLLGQAELNLERYRDAAEHLDFGLRNAAAREAPENLARVEKALELAKKHVGTIEVRVNQSADVSIDGKRIGSTPFGHDVFVEPGIHVLEATAPGFERAVRTLAIARGERQVVELDLTAVEATDSPGAARPVGPSENHVGPEVDDVSALKWPVVVTGAALTVVGLGMGTYFLVQKGKHSSTGADLRRDFPADSCTGVVTPRCEELRRVKSDGQRAAGLALGGLVAGGALAVGTALAWWLWPEPSSTEGAVRAVPVADAGSRDAGSFLGGALTGTF